MVELQIDSRLISSCWLTQLQRNLQLVTKFQHLYVVILEKQKNWFWEIRTSCNFDQMVWKYYTCLALIKRRKFKNIKSFCWDIKSVTIFSKNRQGFHPKHTELRELGFPKPTTLTFVTLILKCYKTCFPWFAKFSLSVGNVGCTTKNTLQKRKKKITLKNYIMVYTVTVISVIIACLQ